MCVCVASMLPFAFARSHSLLLLPLSLTPTPSFSIYSVSLLPCLAPALSYSFCSDSPAILAPAIPCSTYFYPLKRK